MLKDGDTVISESIAILSYLEARHEQPPMFGTDPGQIGQTWQRIHEFENHARTPLIKMAIAIFSHSFADKPDETDELIETCYGQLTWLENNLASAHWMAGANVSAADFVIYPVLKMFLRATGKENARALDIAVNPLSNKYPKTADWLTRVEKLPGYERTYPPHWQS